MNANIKAWFFGSYFAIGLLCTIYLNFWGKESYKSIAYHIGQGLIWPAVIFPSVGKFIGGIIILLFIATLTLRSK
ncbi:MAG: hypothetical protein GX151_02370 [Gammaproteobacteria bacterium]|jgi:hypothetical protein|uniref:hypothetical protein n=1 Tax=Acinetobacter indicus TaxID=756892 RepID=UPI0016A52D05|nr:hypothetical protein [Acinetobacter indicus]MCO8089151.1 hypothetical protein [Acinetobacter indicus]NLN56812.1 hypothetical protein [Gammaproteobacteria bacterium]